MPTPDDRIKVFEDTLSWIDNDPDLSASLTPAKAGTKVFLEDEYPSFDRAGLDSTTITVTGDKSFEAAMRLHKEDPSARIAVMNFANAITPGGGVTKGSNAQEECLCRASTLYPLIYRKSLYSAYYKLHADKKSARATDALIYTPGVVICKSDEALPQRLPKDQWVTVDVITVAAPDLRDQPNIHFDLIGGGDHMTSWEQFGYHVRRAMHILTCAAAMGADTLVLGAFGCGTFRNEPQVVARAYKTALEEFPKVFRKIEFAVYCKPGSSENYDAFKTVLNP